MARSAGRRQVSGRGRAHPRRHAKRAGLTFTSFARSHSHWLCAAHHPAEEVLALQHGARMSTLQNQSHCSHRCGATQRHCLSEHACTPDLVNPLNPLNPLRRSLSQSLMSTVTQSADQCMQSSNRFGHCQASILLTRMVTTTPTATHAASV